MDKQEYFAKLRDPRWQKVRLEVMQRDGFRCRKCNDETTTLNVHHCYYKWGMDPWEYPRPSLITLCEPCHEYETYHAKNVKKEFADILSKAGCTADDMEDLAQAFRARFDDHADDPHFVFEIILKSIRNGDRWASTKSWFLQIRAENEEQNKYQ